MSSERITEYDVLSCINRYAVSKDPQEAIQLLNRLLANDSSESIVWAQMIMANCQLFGFQSYGVKIDKDFFPDACRMKILMNSYRAQQFEYLNSGQLSLLNDLQQNKKILVSAPTSFGKTSLVNEHIIANHNTFSNIIFVLPTNALIDELYDKYVAINKRYGLTYNLTTTPSLAPKSHNIAFLTPERFLMLNSINKNLEDINLIVMDEMNKIINNDNTLEGIDDRSARFRRAAEVIASSGKRCIFLSPYTYNLRPSMQNFVNKYGIKVVNRNIDYINHDVYDVHTKTKVNKLFDTAVDFGSNRPIATKVSALLEQLHGQQTIVYVRCPSDVEKIINSYHISCPIDTNASSQDKERLIAFMKHLESTYIADGVEKWKVIQALEHGIGVHIAPMPRYVKKELVRLFEKKIIKTMIVTTSFVEGVNTNAENIIVTSGSAGRTQLGNIDLLNIIGRAGRFGKSPTGKIFAISNEVYDRVRIAQESENFLTNLNYQKSNYPRNDYDLEKIDDEYLNAPERDCLQDIHELQNRLGLSNDELQISQNVSKSWKLAVYAYLCRLDSQDLEACRNAIEKIYKNESIDELINGVEIVFRHLKRVQVNEGDGGILKQRIGELSPFSLLNNKFVWGALYKMYLQVPTKHLVSYRKKQIVENVEKVCNIVNSKSFRKEILNSIPGYGWLGKYLHSDGSVNDDKIYEETFKFISTVVEYKLPLYVNLFVDMYKLFVAHDAKHDTLSPDINPGMQLLGADNSDVQSMIDYGLSQDLIHRLKKNNITLGDTTDIYQIKEIDDYEKILISEFIKDRI